MGGEFVQVGREILGAKSSDACVVFRISMKGENVFVHFLLGGIWSVVGSTFVMLCGKGARRRILDFTGCCHRP